MVCRSIGGGKMTWRLRPVFEKTLQYVDRNLFRMEGSQRPSHPTTGLRCNEEEHTIFFSFSTLRFCHMHTLGLGIRPLSLLVRIKLLCLVSKD